MMKRLLIGGVPLLVIALGILYAQGVSPMEVVEHFTGKAFAMRERGVEGSGETVSPSVDKSKTSGETERLAGTPAVSVVRVSEARFVERVLVTGSLVAREQVMIAPEVEGVRVLSYEAEEGDFVKKGQLLARLESTTLKSSLEQNTAAIARSDAAIAQTESLIHESEAVLNEAEASLKRARPLRKSRHISGSTFDQREAAALSAKARLQSARSGRVVALAEKAQLVAQRRELTWRLSRSEIRSPIEGLISRRNVRIGDMASSTRQPMFEIVTLGEIELRAEVDERNLVKVKTGQTARVVVADLEPVLGSVRLVSPQVEEVTRLGHARILLGRNPALKIGAFARGTIETARSTGLSVPETAVLYDGQRPSVLRVKGNQVHVTPVEVGLRADGRVEVVSGLRGGDIVVAKSGTFLRDGDFIRPVEAVAEARRDEP